MCPLQATGTRGQNLTAPRHNMALIQLHLLTLTQFLYFASQLFVIYYTNITTI